MPPGVSIQTMSATDAAELEQLFASQRPGYVEHFTPFELTAAAWRSRLAAVKADRYWVVMLAERIAGFCMLRGWDEGYGRPSFGVFVGEADRGKGLAKAALAHCIAWCRSTSSATSMMLKVHPNNAAARSVYEAAGFREMGLCPETGQIVMTLDLAERPLTYIASGAFTGLTLSQVLKAAEPAGVRAIELSSGLVATADEIDEAGRARDRGFHFLIHNYFPATPERGFVLNLADRDEDNRKRSVDFAASAIALCKRLGSPFYSVHAGFGPSLKAADLGSPENYARHAAMTLADRDAALGRLRESLKVLLDVSTHGGVGLLLENNVVAPKTAARPGWHGLLFSEADEITSFYESLPGSGLGLLLDTAHAKVSCQSLATHFHEFVSKVTPHVGAIHISHTDGVVDGNAALRPGTPGLEHIQKFANLPIVVEVYGIEPATVGSQLNLVDQCRSGGA